MKYVSIDIETTGLDPEKHQILEVAAVVDDLTTPLNELPIFHCYLKHNPIIGDPEALAMHGEIIRLIADAGKFRSGNILKPDSMWTSFYNFLTNNGFAPISKGIVVAGKNAASFDIPFLKKLPYSSESMIRFHHRVLDPTMFYLLPEDEVPPGLMECCDRAGLVRPQGHRAVTDAMTVIQLIRKGLSDANEPDHCV